jgi:hypothetical protein
MCATYSVLMLRPRGAPGDVRARRARLVRHRCVEVSYYPFLASRSVEDVTSGPSERATR